jgi:hypothetical protein
VVCRRRDDSRLITSPLRWLRAGPLTLALDGIDIRYVRLGEQEIVRRMYIAVRDPQWRTVAGVASDVELDVRDDSFAASFSVRHVCDDLDFSWYGRISGSANGRIRLAMDGRAERDSLYNRIGICVLHPWRECAGRPFRGEGPDGPVEGALPRLVGRQAYREGRYVALFDPVSRLEIGLENEVSAVFEFEGEVFETEDQRNWSDASFKTYSTPLARGFPHTLDHGQSLVQSASLHARGPAAPPVTREAERHAVLYIGPPVVTAVPPVGLSLAEQDPSARELALLRELAPAHIRVDLFLSGSEWRATLLRGLRLCDHLGAALELALHVQAGDDLSAIPAALGEAEIARVLVLAAGARTTQRDETTPAELVASVRAGLPLGSVPIAAGTGMHFCELNRTRPPLDLVDAVFWPIDAQVHATDDLSLLETPEAQGEQLRAARAFAPGKLLFVGPVTLARQADPRQACPIGAAWTAASAKHLADGGADAITYFETNGPCGIADKGRVFPLHRVLADLASLRSAAVLACTASRPLEIAGLVVRRGGETTLLAANLTPTASIVEVNSAGFRGTLALGPYAVVRETNSTTSST